MIDTATNVCAFLNGMHGFLYSNNVNFIVTLSIGLISKIFLRPEVL